MRRRGFLKALFGAPAAAVVAGAAAKAPDMLTGEEIVRATARAKVDGVKFTQYGYGYRETPTHGVTTLTVTTSTGWFHE